MQSSNMSAPENSSKSSKLGVRSARSNKRKRNNLYNKDRKKTDVAESKKIKKFKQVAKKTSSEVIGKWHIYGGCALT